MTNRDVSADTNQQDDDTRNSFELFSHLADETDTGPQQSDNAQSANNASYSLGRLEQDLRLLHTKWRAVEKEMVQRDREISALKQELKSSAEEYDRAILARDAEIKTEQSDHVVELEAKNVELRLHLQELKDYIDGRKNDWDRLNAKVVDYEDTIQGMSNNLDAHDDAVAEVEKQKADLALKVMDLERELAELKGRHTERESSHAALQQSLDDQSRELGSLNAEATGLRKDIVKLQKKLDSKEETVCSLRKKLKDHSRDSSSLEGLLSDEKATIAKLQVSLQAAEERVADLEAEQKDRDTKAGELGTTIGELRERLRLSEPAIGMQELRITELENSVQAGEASAKELRDELANALVKLKEMSQKAAEHEIRAAEFQAALLEMESRKKDVDKELEAQRELVDVLEFEVGNKQENLDILDRSVDRLSAIGSEIRELDVQIGEHWLEQPDEVLLQPEELFSNPDEMVERVIVSEDKGVGEPVRYSLTGTEMTIGRSHKNDIRINSKYISRVHARIKIDGSRVTIEDAGSTNGFLVNSVHSTHHTLAHGDKLEIGRSKFCYLDTSST